MGLFGGDSGGGGDTKLTTTQMPWDEARGFLKNSYQRANQLYNEGQGFNPWNPNEGISNFINTIGFDPGGQGAVNYGLDPNALRAAATSGVTPLNALQRQGQERMTSVANSYATPTAQMGQAQDWFNRSLQSGYNGNNVVNDFASGAAGRVQGNPYFDRDFGMTGYAEGRVGIGPNQYMDRTQQALTGAAEGQWLDRANANPYMGQREKTLTDTAGGGFLNANPYLEGQYQAASRGLKEDFATSTLPALAAQFSGGGGAHGSPDHQYWAGKAGGDLMDTLGDMRSNMYGQNYQAERDRMLNAGSQLQGVNQQNAGLYSQNYQAERNNMLGAAGQLQGTDMQRAGMYNDMRNSDLNRSFGATQSLMNRDAQQMGQWSSDQQQNANRQYMAANQLNGMGEAGAAGALGLDNMLYGRQLQGAQLLGQAGDMDYNIANQLTNRAQSQYQQYQQEPWQRLGAYTSTVFGNPASGMTSSSQGGAGGGGGGSQFGAAAGGALSGAATGAMVGGLPGAFVGGGLGLLGGFF